MLLYSLRREDFPDLLEQILWWNWLYMYLHDSDKIPFWIIYSVNPSICLMNWTDLAQTLFASLILNWINLNWSQAEDSKWVTSVWTSKWSESIWRNAIHLAIQTDRLIWFRKSVGRLDQIIFYITPLNQILAQPS